MSLVNLAHVCSHLQNASKARLGLTSIPLTNLHLKLALGLQKEGFISTVQIGGAAPPVPDPASIAEESSTEIAAKALRERPWLAYPDPTGSNLFALEGRDVDAKSRASTPPSYFTSVSPYSNIPTNPAARRLWLGLKYWRSEPVLSRMRLISKPTRRIAMGSKEIGRISRGKNAKNEKGHLVDGLTNPGECVFISTDRGVMESRECAEKKMGGLLLCRVV